ncbi:MAG: hypothetical protein E2P03_07600 [Acidobacteria bacterium]|nr:MAG: hypothetical protein E2P03_07600 [Acidobacteriota bacterium]
MTRRLMVALFVILIHMGWPASPALAGRPQTVRIQLPMEARMDTEGYRRILVGGFLHNDSPVMDIEKELVRILRRELEKNSDFLILADPPPSLPEQRLEELKKNAPFFVALAEEFRADLIITGRILYTSVDRSGFVQGEYISPTTGRRTIRSYYVDRTGYTLKLDLIFVRGSDGQLVYDTSFIQEVILDTDESDPLGVFFDLAERFHDNYLAVMVPRSRTEIRYLFTE